MIGSVLRLAASLAMVGSVHAQASASSAGWTLVARFVPNPLPAGRCGRADIEIRDKDGYRTTQLSNQQAVDFRQFQYSLGPTQLTWRNGDPTDGYLCAPATATRSTTTLTVKTPDGITGSVDVITLAPGQVAVAVQYVAQAPLRKIGIPVPSGAAAPSATSQLVVASPTVGVMATQSNGGAPTGSAPTSSTTAATECGLPTTPGPAPSRSGLSLLLKGTKSGDFKTESPTGMAVTSIDFQVMTPIDSITGAPRSQRRYSTLTITKPWSAATPMIFQSAVANEVLTTVSLAQWQNDVAGKSTLSGCIQLTNATIVGVRFSSDSGRVMEHVSFTFQKIEISNVKAGTAAVDSWSTMK